MLAFHQEFERQMYEEEETDADALDDDAAHQAAGRHHDALGGGQEMQCPPVLENVSNARHLRTFDAPSS